MVHLAPSAGMPISAQQWRVSVGLFNCSRMRWLLKGGGAKKKAPAPSPSTTNARRVVKSGVPLLLLYLAAIACVMPPLLLLIQSGDVELNPGPVESGTHAAGSAGGGREWGVCQGVWQCVSATSCFSSSHGSGMGYMLS